MCEGNTFICVKHYPDRNIDMGVYNHYLGRTYGRFKSLSFNICQVNDAGMTWEIHL